MPGFREHVVEKYFAYRRRYVDYFVEHDPARARLALLSEVARLIFVSAGAALIAAILWVLAVGASAKTGVWWLWRALFAPLAAIPTAALLASLAGLTAALADRARVEARTRAPALHADE